MRHCPFPDRLSLGRAAGAPGPFSLGAGDAGLGSRHQPQGARSVSRHCALSGRQEDAQGQVPRACARGVERLGTLPPPTARLWGVQLGPATHWLWGGVRAWGTALRTVRLTQQALRSVGAAMVHLWGRLLQGWVFLGTLSRVWFVASSARFPGMRRPLLLGTCPCALFVDGSVHLWLPSSGLVALSPAVSFPVPVMYSTT